MAVSKRRSRAWMIPVAGLVLLGAFVASQQLGGDGDPKQDGLVLAKPAGASGPPVTIEASFRGQLTSHPRDHHLIVNNRDDDKGETADWAADWKAAAGTQVRPQLSGPYGTELFVIDIVEACRGGGGGASVKVGVRAPNTGEWIGWAAYAHLSGLRVAKGQKVERDTVLGVIGNGFPINENCWTGPHLHLEGFNEYQYSCYRDHAQGAVADPGTALGRIGGDDVTGPRQACP